MASIGWIDFSPSHRERVGTILELLEPAGMIDELGIGGIRDALADQLFPGISTIQTRAKYFFIIPYILYDYQHQKPRQRRVTAAQYLEQREYEIMWQLGDKYRRLAQDEESHKSFGVIGINRAKPLKIIRRPSAIYWNGLRTYDIIATGGIGVNQFLQRCTNVTLESQLSAATGDDSPWDDEDAEHENLFRIKIPPPQPGWDEELSLDMTEEEAEILNDRIQAKGKGCLIGELMSNDALYEEFQAMGSFMDFAKKAIHVPIPAHLRQLIILAHDFSELLYGAHIAYNHLLQQLKRPDEHHGALWEEWIKNVRHAMIDFEGFEPGNIFEHYAFRTKSFTRSFVLEWWDLVRHGGEDLQRRNALIINQEKFNKSGKARLAWKKLDDVGEGRWIGLRTLDYRYHKGKGILTDIKNGLGENHVTP